MTQLAATPAPALSTLPPLVVRRIGDGSVPILALHGLSASSAFWLPLAEELRHDCTLTIPDLLGFGRSSKPKIDYTVDAHRDALAPIVDEMPATFVIAGHSMGAALAVALAARWPERVERVVLLNGPLNKEYTRKDERFGEISWWSKLFGAIFYGLAPVWARVGYRLRREIPREVVRDYFRHTTASYTTSLRNVVFRRDVLAEVAELRQPVLAIQGGADGVVGDSSALAWPANVEVHIIPSATHTWPLTNPVEAAALIRPFVAQPANRR
ncbi:MAG: alpha/beta hydrolase [Dehalococcoidia bacterium]